MFSSFTNIFISVLLILAFLTGFESKSFERLFRKRAAQCSALGDTGTTRDLKQIFLGRCYYYINVVQSQNCDFNSSKYDCNRIWNKFYQIVTNQSSCTIDDYNDFFKLTDHYIPVNRSLFWSGTYAIAHAFSKANQYYSLEDSFNGYLFDSLSFCVNNSNFITNKPCPGFDCKYRNFWSAASRNFAQRARGEVLIILNGTRITGAVTNTSTFNTIELPQFNSANIQKVNVYLLQAPDLNVVEKCANGTTITQLRNTLKERHIRFKCNDNPKSLYYYMCFTNPTSKACH